jgi:hypothetical protein
MKHKTIQKRLLRFLDNELPENEFRLIKSHLATCNTCRNHLQQLTAIWQVARPIPRISPPPFVWTRLSHRLENEKRVDFWKRVARHLWPYARPAVAVTTILVTILVGIEFGRQVAPPPTDSSLSFIQTSTVREEFGTDYFSVLTPGDVGEPMITLTADERGVQP